jgi:hypothetical protein
MARPQIWVEDTKRAKESKQVVSFKNQKPSFIPRTKLVNPTTPSAPLKIQKLTRAEMSEHQLKGLCYNCDDKYFQGHKCKEKNLFMAISEDVLEEDVETPLVSESPETTDITPPSDPPEVELITSLNALTSFFALQTLKIIGYIKHRKVIILVDSGNTHNFIHRHISQESHCYIHVVNNFQILIANGGSMKCGGHYENVHLQIGDYHLKLHMFSIDMGGCDIVLGADWLRTLGPILMDFKELTMQFNQKGQKYNFQGIIVGSLISSHSWKVLVVEPDYLSDSEVFYFQPCLYPMKYLHPRSMYTLPYGGVQRRGTPSMRSEGAIPLARGSGGKQAPNGGSGEKPLKEKLPCKCIL